MADKLEKKRKPMVKKSATPLAETKEPLVTNDQPAPGVRGDLSPKKDVFNAETAQVLRDADAGKNLTRYVDEDDLFRKLGDQDFRCSFQAVAKLFRSRLCSWTQRNVLIAMRNSKRSAASPWKSSTHSYGPCEPTNPWPGGTEIMLFPANGTVGGIATLSQTGF